MIFQLEICRGITVCHWQTNSKLVLGDLLLPTHHHHEIAGNFELTLLRQGQLELATWLRAQAVKSGAHSGVGPIPA